MGSSSSSKPGSDHLIPVKFNKKLYIVIDFYFKSKIVDNINTNTINLEALKNNNELKAYVKDIILSAFSNIACKAHISDTNIIFMLRSKNNEDYLELNTVVDLSSDPRNSEYNKKYMNPSNDITIQGIRMAIVSILFTHTSKQYGIVVSPTETVVILYNTLYDIDVYQNP
jgi:hypothetical protein